jgi:hypothetical protein
LIKTTSIHNFLAVERTLTNNPPINSAQQVEDHGNMKKAEIFILGKQPVFKKLPLNNFLAVQLIFTSNIPAASFQTVE